MVGLTFNPEAPSSSPTRLLLAGFVLGSPEFNPRPRL